MGCVRKDQGSQVLSAQFSRRMALSLEVAAWIRAGLELVRATASTTPKDGRMIRDPSDGSVREHTGPICKGCGAEFYYDFVPRPNDSSGYCENCFERPKSVPLEAAGPLIETATSGLQTGSEKPENIARLEKAREWLADYHAKKNAK